jgi:3-oxoacyl-[acyl-carrier protein] reductase
MTTNHSQESNSEKKTAMDGSLRDRVALITGGGTGIGAATALCFAKAGAAVAVHFHTSQRNASEVVARIESLGGRAMAVCGDLTNSAAAAEVVEAAVAYFGGLDILVNNAGSPIMRTRLETCTDEIWHQVLATNLSTAFFVTRQAIPHLRKSGHGAIINNLSLSVQTGGANGAGPYAIAKGGLQVMTRTLAKELAPEVRVNAVMPGVIETPHHERFTEPARMSQYANETPLRRNGVPAEVAEAIVFLASDAARFINGALLDINGGRFLR